MKQIFRLVVCILIIAILGSFASDLDEWKAFKTKYSKNYQNEAEEKFRASIFLNNKRKIVEHNELYEKGLVTFIMGVNKYSDLAHNELSAIKGLKSEHFLGLENGMRKTRSYFVQSNKPIRCPSSMDWRDKGAVTAVKDQGHCGSCWAFATTGAIEGQYFLKNGKLLSFSEQNLIDCSIGNGCDGGFLEKSFQYVEENGITTENLYPYTAHDGICQLKLQNSNSVKIHNVTFIPEGDEDKLREAIATAGPIAISIDASHASFHFYQKGIYYEPHCSPKYLSHSVLAIGYGTDKNGQDYYICKNSWGEDWGDKGYFKLARNRKNHCGVATDAMFPVF